MRSSVSSSILLLGSLAAAADASPAATTPSTGPLSLPNLETILGSDARLGVPSVQRADLFYFYAVFIFADKNIAGGYIEPEMKFGHVTAREINAAVAPLRDPKFLDMTLEQQGMTLQRALNALSEFATKLEPSASAMEWQLVDSIATQVMALRDLVLADGFRGLDAGTRREALSFIGELSSRIVANPVSLEAANRREFAAPLVMWMFNACDRLGAEGDAPILTAKAKNGASILSMLSELISQEGLAPAEEAQRIFLALDILADLKSPSLAASHAPLPRCPSASIMHAAVTREPADYVRQVVELARTRKTTFPGGAEIELEPETVSECLMSKKSASAALFQASCLTYTALTSPRRTDEVSEVGLTTRQAAALASAYYGQVYDWFGGTAGLRQLMERDSTLPVFGILREFEAPGANSNLFISFTRAGKERLFFHDTYLNYGLYADVSEAGNGRHSEVVWHWADGEPAGKNPLPPHVIPLVSPNRAGSSEIYFAARNGREIESSFASPHFMRPSPERRMESWNDGTFSITDADLRANNPIFLLPVAELQKYGIITTQLTQLDSSHWPRTIFLGAVGGGMLAIGTGLAVRNWRRRTPPEA